MLETTLPSLPSERECWPEVGICVSIPPWKEYCWPLLAESMVRLDYPRDRLRLLILVDGDSGSFERAVLDFQDRHADRFAQLVVESGADVARRLRRQDALTYLCPPGCRGQVHGTRLRQRMLEYFLYGPVPAPDYLFSLDSDALWPPFTLRRLVELSRAQDAPTVGILPYRYPGKHLILFWFPNPPTGRLVPYNPPDPPEIPFRVDFATMGGTLMPLPMLRAFEERGGWYPYPISGYPDGQVPLGDDVYVFQGSGRRVPPWAHPDVSGWHVEADGWAQRWVRNAATGEGEIVERLLDLTSFGVLDELEERTHVA